MATKCVEPVGRSSSAGQYQVPLVQSFRPLSRNYKVTVVSCHLCWASRHLGKAILQTKVSCYLCWVWDPLVGTAM